MLQTRFEARSGPCFSPDAPSGPAGKGIAGRLNPDDPTMPYIQQAASQHFLESNEEFDPKRVSLVPMQLDDASRAMLAEHGVTNDPLLIIYDQRELNHGHPVEIRGECDRYGNINVDVKQPHGDSYPGFYITDFTIRRKYYVELGLEIEIYRGDECLPFGLSDDHQSLNMPLIDLHDSIYDTYITYVTLPIDQIRKPAEAQTARPAESVKPATAAKPAPPLPVIPSSSSTQEATARPPRIETTHREIDPSAQRLIDAIQQRLDDAKIVLPFSLKPTCLHFPRVLPDSDKAYQALKNIPLTAGRFPILIVAPPDTIDEERPVGLDLKGKKVQEYGQEKRVQILEIHLGSIFPGRSVGKIEMELDKHRQENILYLYRTRHCHGPISHSYTPYAVTLGNYGANDHLFLIVATKASHDRLIDWDRSPSEPRLDIHVLNLSLSEGMLAGALEPERKQ